MLFLYDFSMCEVLGILLSVVNWKLSRLLSFSFYTFLGFTDALFAV